jgi:hypothetical protein
MAVWQGATKCPQSLAGHDEPFFWVVDGLAIQIQHTTDHCDCQMSIKPHEIPHFGHIFVRLKCKIFHNKVRLPLSHGHPKMLYAT